MLHLRLLGPVQLGDGQTVVDLGVKKSLALLVLLERRGRLSRTEVTGLLWPELDESSARRNLRRELARLRDAGAPGAVLTDGDWLLPGPALRSDAAAMREALDLGHPTKPWPCGAARWPRAWRWTMHLLLKTGWPASAKSSRRCAPVR